MSAYQIYFRDQESSFRKRKKKYETDFLDTRASLQFAHQQGMATTAGAPANLFFIDQNVSTETFTI